MGKLLGLGLNTGMSVMELAKWSRRGERSGFDSIWLSEYPDYRDALPLMSIVALNTNRVKIATGIVNVYTKHPVYMAMAASTLDEISHGRLILGVGRGVKSLIEGELGINYGSPTDYVREYLTCLRRLLSGEAVTFRGRMVSMTNARLHYDPLRADIPILLAAMGPKTIRLARKYGNGMIMNSCSSVRLARFARRTIGRSLQGGGEPEVACSLWVSINEDMDKAYDSVRTSVGFLLSIPTFGELFLGKSGLPEDSLGDLRKPSAGTRRWEIRCGILPRQTPAR